MTVTQSAGQIAAALVDLGLPDRPGDEVVLEILRLMPALPIVIVSGREESEIRERLAGHPAAVVAKPYTAEALLNALETLGITPP